jgi:hypothetical protein
MDAPLLLCQGPSLDRSQLKPLMELLELSGPTWRPARTRSTPRTRGTTRRSSAPRKAKA